MQRIMNHGPSYGRSIERPDNTRLHSQLLALPRIGKETADTIMLYAGGHPVFIVDAYARRLLGRLGIAPGFDFARARYDDVQALVENAITRIEDRSASLSSASPNTSLRQFYWDLHALIIEECIHHCLASRPRQDQPGARRSFVDPRKCAEHCLVCHGCPLREMCAFYMAQPHTDA
jgi:endonuclease-3 related protein